MFLFAWPALRHLAASGQPEQSPQPYILTVDSYPSSLVSLRSRTKASLLPPPHSYSSDSSS